MRSIVKLLITILLIAFLASCNSEESIKKSLVGKWEYTIEISFKGTNYNTNQSISETKMFSGTFTWDEDLYGLLEGDIEYSYLDGAIGDFLEMYGELRLGFTGEDFGWSENGKQYKAFCDWKNVPVKYNMKEFTVESGSYSWVEVTNSDGSEIFCSYVEATLKARKIR